MPKCYEYFVTKPTKTKPTKNKTNLNKTNQKKTPKTKPNQTKEEWYLLFWQNKDYIGTKNNQMVPIGTMPKNREDIVDTE